MFDHEDLDAGIRGLMLQELEDDIASGRVYFSTRFTDQGRAEYGDLMRQAIASGSSSTLADALNTHGRIAETETRNGKAVKVPHTAAMTFAQGEFNRMYCRAMCRRALQHGVNEVQVYRAKQVSNPREQSEALIGQRLPATTLLDDLRTNIGVDPALHLPNGPNSGLSVRCACKECLPE